MVTLKHVYSLVIDAVLIVDVQQFVFDPADLLGWLFSSLVVQTVFLIKLSQTHHGLLTYSPLGYEKAQKSNKIEGSSITILQEWRMSWFRQQCSVLSLSHPFVQGSIPYEAQQLVINQVEVFLPSVNDGDDDIMTDGFLWVMGPNFQILWLGNRKVLVEEDDQRERM